MSTPRLVAILITMVAVLAAAPSPVGAAQQVRVVVSGHGFDPPIVEVTEGELVELTLVYGDDPNGEDNPHIIVIEGLGIESPVLSLSNPQATLRFTAERSGRLRFKCVAYCHGHDRLQEGYVNVRPPTAAGSAQAAAAATALQLVAAPPEAPGAMAALRAQLTSAGLPVEGVIVRFDQQATLVKTGWTPIGRVRTDDRGVARLEYRPFGDALKVQVRAVFEGTVRYGPTQAAAAVDLPGLATWWKPPAAVHIPVIGIGLLWAVLAGVWLTFGYTLYQVFTLPEREVEVPGTRHKRYYP
ncbi:MAG TPA: hypothetical protein VGR24_02275 [bacterium]|jgi:hypothetical protein|nr:hypothetical protein [bacterium]